MQKPKKIVLVAGEESGDVLAAQLVAQLRRRYPNCVLSGIGGNHLQAQGVTLISDLARYGVTGITEVVTHFRAIRQAFKLIKAHLLETKPDLLILIDYPGFNLRLAKYAKKQLGLKILYYISPQIWAWKANRIHTIKECVDHMAVILPFEKSIYQQAGVPVSFVGHPLVDKIQQYAKAADDRKALALPEQRKIIALLPGSRKNEIKQHMPILRDTAQAIYKNHQSVHFVIPIAGTMDPKLIKNYFDETTLPVTFVLGKAIECMAASDFVFVASGTASLECALLNKPMCIIYKSNFLTYHLAMKFVRVRFLGLCNLLANTMLVAEFLQYDCNAQELARYWHDFTNNPEQPQQMINKLAELKQTLSSQQADCSLIDLIATEIV